MHPPYHGWPPIGLSLWVIPHGDTKFHARPPAWAPEQACGLGHKFMTLRKASSRRAWPKPSFALQVFCCQSSTNKGKLRFVP
ncbi:hypothetical protein MPNT_130012 [Candidatus Methylacidithermus pantelleriae]|uniref:Uncharacterized protein n=1 Tax=Candidatus Methylacidithermus pantelleriae TaxID=2744239 RepID=A0A8J2BRR2_9BACT|nr:hypothetical protein MPNT_130012 [Candidatus Methylacidithermus pantelleriae]